MQSELESFARETNGWVTFLGLLDRAAYLDILGRSHVGLMLNGAAMELIAAYVVINVVVRLALVPAGLFVIAYSGPDSAVDFPNATVLLVSSVTVLVAVALFVAARLITARVHYQATGSAQGSQPGVPPA